MGQRIGMARLALLLLVASLGSVRGVDLIPLGSTWKYFLGVSEASSPTTAWRQNGYNDSAFATGVAPIGYDTGGTPGTAPIVTLLPDPRTAGNPVWNSTYFRKSFVVADPSRVTSLIFTLFVDDGAIVWINGNEVGRINVPDGELPFNGAADVADETRILTTTNISRYLVAGANVIAVHAFNGPAASSDFVFEGNLTATLDEAPAVAAVEPLPGSIVTTLTTLDVSFSEAVSGVDASDLLINGTPATNVTVISPLEYVFSFAEPATGVVNVAWSAAPGILDVDSPADLFVPGAAWHYTLDPNVISAPLIISEFLADNSSGIEDDDGTRSDWLEIYNPGTLDINLNGWFLTDTASNLTTWRFPSINLAPNKYLLVWASGKNRTNSAAPLHANFKLAKNAGSYLALVNPQTNVVSSFTYPAQNADISYGRDRVDPGIIGYFITPTPGAQNALSGANFAPEPVFSLQSGVYTNDSLTLTLAVPAGNTIRYTLDGTEPKTNSLLYSGPITFTTNMMIKARAFSSNPSLFPSAVKGRSFVMLDSTTAGFSSNIPLLIISTHGTTIPASVPPGGTRPKGVFVAVDTFRGRSSLRGKADYNGFGQFEIVGQTSAGGDFLKKPHRVELNDELGNDNKASILGLPAEADWMLRNPWSDKCLINDFLGYELWDNMGHYSCRRRLVEVFIDTGGGKLNYPGDYYGVMVLFERIEVGNNRVNIAELTPSQTNEPAISGGYIFKKDKDSAGDTAFTTIGGAGHPAQTLKFHEPKPRDITMAQSNWIRNYTRQFETALYAANWTNATGTNHYSYYIDVDSFVDQQLHVEFTKQIDGYRLSSYYSKDRGGKIKPNPVWDWNLSFGNANYCEGGRTNSWYWNRQPATDGFSVSAGDHIWLRRLIYGLPNITTTPPYTESNGPGDPEFRQKITDRWAVLRTNVLNGDRVIARIDELANLLTEAAARNYTKYPSLLNNYQWPNPEGPPWDVDYTQPTYAAIIVEMKRWVRGHSDWMDSQFLRAPSLSRPSGSIGAGTLVTLSAPNGVIYYTTNGTDPRLPGGGISPAAALYTGPISVSANAGVVARSYANPTTLWTPWSATASATYVVAAPKLVVTEIMYHPAPAPLGSTNNDEDFEYIEVKNTGAAALNLNGYSLAGGIDFTFSNRTVNPGERILVVKSRSAFTNRYGAALTSAIAGEYTGSLNNDGDHILLQGPVHDPILDFRFDDEWYPITDGFGFSLVAVDENAAALAWSTKPQWRPSGVAGGTPGQPKGAPPVFPRVVVNEALSHNDVGLGLPNDVIELQNLGGSAADISGWFLTDDYGQPMKYRFPPGTTFPANGYLTIDQTVFNAGTGGNIPFALGAHGDEVYLFSGDLDGNLTGYYHGFGFDAARPGVTFGRYVVSTGEEEFVLQSSRTLGALNAGPLIGPVVISEVMYRPTDVFTNGAYWNDGEDEFVELVNITASPVSLFDPAYPTNSWRLDNAVNYTFPSNTTIAPFGTVVVVNFNPATELPQLAAFRAKYNIPLGVPVFGPYEGSLDNHDANVALYSPDVPDTDGSVHYILADRVHYRDIPPWPLSADGYGHSLQRVVLSAYGNDPTNWTASAPTPGGALVLGTNPTITINPISQTVPVTASVTFGGVASGPGPIRYQWRQNGELINGATNNVLVFTNVSIAQAGEYQLVALNSSGAAFSTPATLTVVLAATIVQQPASLTVTNGTNAALSVVATSQNPPLFYQWYRGGQPLPGATNAVLSLTNVQEDPDSGIYLVAVTDGVGTILSAPATLTVLLPPALINPVPPMRITTVAGQNILLSVETTGTRPMFFRWQRILTNGSSVFVANKLTNSHNDFLAVNNVNPVFDGAVFRVSLSNAANNAITTFYTNAIFSVLADSNSNGIPNVWETAYFGSPTGADRDADTDGDGMSNFDEYVAGTNPIDPLSYLKVTWGVNVAALTFEAVSNRSYSVQFKDTLAAPAWTRLSDVVARSSNWTAVIADTTARTNRFYRIVTPRQD